MNYKMTGGVVARSRYRGVINTWLDRQWVALPPERRPEGAIRFGFGWVQLAPEGRPVAASPDGVGADPGPSVSPRGGKAMAGPDGVLRGLHAPAEALIVDPASPAVREFLHRSTLEGLIRTVPAGPGRILVLPSPVWSQGRPPRPGVERT